MFYILDYHSIKKMVDLGFTNLIMNNIDTCYSYNSCVDIISTILLQKKNDSKIMEFGSDYDNSLVLMDDVIGYKDVNKIFNLSKINIYIILI